MANVQQWIRRTVILAVACLPFPALAADKEQGKAELKQPCRVDQSNQLSVSFIAPLKSMDEGASKFKAVLIDLNTMMVSKGFTNYRIQSTSLAVNSMALPYVDQPGPLFQLIGKVAYSMETVDDAYKAGKILLTKNYQVGVTDNKGYSSECKSQNILSAP